MSSASRITLVVFLASVLAVLGLLGFLTTRMLRLERDESIAKFEARRQESLRLALWRMDSAVAPIIAQEAARPYFHYLPYYPEQRAFTRVWEPVRPGEVLVPSPLVEGTPPYVLLHFQVGADGRVSSPQVPQGNDRDLAESEPGGAARVEHYEKLLASLASLYFDGRDSRREVAAGRTAVGDETAALRGGEMAENRMRAQGADTSSDAEREYGYRKEAAELASRPAPVTGQVPGQVASPPSDSRAAGAEQRQIAEELAPAAPAGAQTLNELAFDGREDVVADMELRDRAFEARDSTGVVIGGVGGEGRTETMAGTENERSLGLPTAGETAHEGAPVEAELESGERLRKAPAVDRRLGANLLDLAPARAGLPIPETVFRRRGSRFGVQGAGPARPDLSQSAFVPRWRHGGGAEPAQLLVWRSVRAESSTTIQGFWVDWPALERHLLSRIGDVLPGASIVPVLNAEALEPSLSSRLLASIPAMIVPPPEVIPSIPLVTPSHVTVALTWLATLAGVGAVGMSLRASIALGERRGRFVSAVTHELRTPLTTFVLYSQMLADGMVPEGEARREYLTTLKGEATRLQRIVENVLEFARLGRGGGGNGSGSRAIGAAPVRVGALLEEAVPALRQRAAQAGMTLESSIDPAAAEATTRASSDAVARIVANLVDNACKYAAEAEERVITLHAGVTRDGVLIRVRDRGPGVPASERRRIFRAFARGRSHETSATQGLGLGLSLARAIARQHGGDLTLDRGTSGASFTLRLPRES